MLEPEELLDVEPSARATAMAHFVRPSLSPVCARAHGAARRRQGLDSPSYQRRVLAHAADLERRGPDGLPLYGIPFAIKDNIDLAGPSDHRRLP